MSDIQIHTHSQTNNFTIVANEVINHQSLSLEAKSLLIWCISKPLNWKLNTLGLAKIHNISKNKVSAISKELQKNNYLIIVKGYNGMTTWHFFGTTYDFRYFKSVQREPIATEDNQGRPENTPIAPVVAPYPHIANVSRIDDPYIDDHQISDVLLRTDPIQRTIPKILCPSDDVQKGSIIDETFEDVWTVWPNVKQKIRAKKSYKAVLKKLRRKSPDSVKEFCKTLKTDIQERLRLTMNVFDDGFRNSMFSTYLNGSGWLEELPAKPQNVANTDESNQANNNKANSLLKEYGYK
jgi:hypothetical protein